MLCPVQCLIVVFNRSCLKFYHPDEKTDIAALGFFSFCLWLLFCLTWLVVLRLGVIGRL